MKQKLFVLLAALFVGAALTGLAGWGLSQPAAASPERGEFERQYHAANKSHDLRHSEKGEREYSRYDDDYERDDHDGDYERDDHDGDYERDDHDGDYSGVTASTAGTTVTTAGTTVTTQAPTTTTQSTTTTTQAPTTTTQAPTTTTQPPTTSTTSINAAALFASKCASCHGSGGIPIRTSLTESQILGSITSGSMRGYASGLTSAELSALAKYIAAGGR